PPSASLFPYTTLFRSYRILGSIVFPLLKPALAVVAINAFLVNWNSFLYPLIFVDSDKLRTLPVGLALFSQGEHGVDWGLLMAGSDRKSTRLNSSHDQI